MLSKIDGFLEICVNGFDVQVTPIQTSGLSTTIKNILSEIGCQQPNCFETLEGKVHTLQRLNAANNMYSYFLVTGVVLSISSLAIAIFASYLLGLALAVTGIALICGGLRISHLYETKKLPEDIELIQKDVNLSGEWVSQLQRLKRDENLSAEQLDVVGEAFTFGSSHLLKIKESF